jgi:hypothetical protein
MVRAEPAPHAFVPGAPRPEKPSKTKMLIQIILFSGNALPPGPFG